MRPQSPTTSPGELDSARDTHFECREIARCLAAFGAISDAARALSSIYTLVRSNVWLS